ncbi:helix-turn-helix domain-containing protein [Pseudomonas sp. YQ_13]|uniref:helix-turn-helix domain-containing protein n=1 Tax=Pseudomonas sp. YQ_13 TaxID=3367235 RepID=UPI00370CE4F6
MNTLTEAQAEWLLGQLQLAAERAPMELRPKRRQLVRGMRAVLNALAEDMSTRDMRNALVAELGTAYPNNATPPKPVRELLVPYDDPTALDREIIERWNVGMGRDAIAKAVGCSVATVERVVRWCDSAAKGEQPTEKQRSLVHTKQQANGH